MLSSLPPPQVHTEAVDAAQYELCIQSATAWMPSEVVHALRRTVAQLIQPAPNAASMTRAQDESAIQSRLSSVRVRSCSLSLCVLCRASFVAPLAHTHTHTLEYGWCGNVASG